MKGKFCLIISLMILSLAISSYAVLTQSYKSKEENIEEMIHIRKIKKIVALPSKSPRDRQWGGREPPSLAAAPNAV
ncbi:unnamed protein product [Eruca vesicaria subsp. sativa]|uniref:Uncharacterized protein n=1 Tax=Eruca vesicaria subsp. sativa TaxID=29727 RepID=A0ABC8JZG3_ERUVS|nr:unnamed protein product [Eruca vesicaria subsp. sativa]